ncbi:GNAT family N-acetyltransferase [Sphingobacterium arenae]|uniref:GNAT family N-acetyltransferase n=1 Tax=Sphingobacterium arenae TaxID=1280598 RepID=A0ABR7Y8V2_9SPHI|nr:GNAT family N-acetyltransferase [Sphingobacterium arenae]MBD1427745.1 GNAT family N-acetyltransferase [Sphingobacterium arenae]
MDSTQLTPLDWDSEFFGYRVAKLEAKEPIDFSSSFDPFFRLVYVFSQRPINELESKLMDKKACFHMETINVNKNIINQCLLIEPFDERNHSYNRLKNLTLESGVFSRFFVDKNFANDEYSKLYTKWIENSVNKTSAIEVFVALEDNELLGFITLTKKTQDLADIGLLAVSPGARGRKVASSLIEHVKDYAVNIGFRQMQVVTQLDNSPAVKLYESVGFELKELTYIYHIWNYDTI